MYAIIDGICFLGGIAGFVVCFVKGRPELSPIPIVWIGIYPIFNELVYNLFASCASKVNYDIAPSSRIVYKKSYNISFCGIERMHPFDSQKYGNVFARLQEMGIIKSDSDVIQPGRIPRSLLL